MIEDLASRLLSTMQNGEKAGLWERVAVVCVMAFILSLFLRPLLPAVCVYLAMLLITRRLPGMSVSADHVRATVVELARPRRS